MSQVKGKGKGRKGAHQEAITSKLALSVKCAQWPAGGAMYFQIPNVSLSWLKLQPYPESFFIAIFTCCLTRLKYYYYYHPFYKWETEAQRGKNTNKFTIQVCLGRYVSMCETFMWGLLLVDTVLQIFSHLIPCNNCKRQNNPSGTSTGSLC